MKPQTIGRVLGIGMRVAGRMAGQHLAAGAGSSAVPPPVEAQQTPTRGSGSVLISGRAAGRATGSVARGVGGFLRPFRRVGNIVFLEVVGAFFLLFVILFGNWAWKLRDQAAHGPEHQKFLVYAVMTLVFLYLGVSSFWRAKRK